ncbi:MAG: hypothetical protein JXA82_14180 [Sedimentisphaerales bacterium]|nr:hypothetical protein [Sedimentisphaerales bacterium]
MFKKCLNEKRQLILSFGMVFSFYCPFAYSQIVSTFDTGTEGWLIVQMEHGFHFPITEAMEPHWSANEGLIDGGIYTCDYYKITLFSAPTMFLGNQTEAFGSDLHFDIWISYTSDEEWPAVILEGAAKNLYYNMPPTMVGNWTHRSISLVGAGWRKSWRGGFATDTDMMEVLANLQGLYINAEWSDTGDLTYLDNVVFPGIPHFCGDQDHPYPEVDLSFDCRVDLFDIAEFSSQWSRIDCSSDNDDCDGADFNLNGIIDLEDLSMIASEWLMCTDVICP